MSTQPRHHNMNESDSIKVSSQKKQLKQVSPEPIEFPTESTSLLAAAHTSPRGSFQSLPSPPPPAPESPRTSISPDLESQSFLSGKRGFLRLFLSWIPILHDLYQTYLIPIVIKLDIFTLCLLILNDVYEVLYLDVLKIDITIEQICILICLLWCWIMDKDSWILKEGEFLDEECQEEEEEEEEEDTEDLHSHVEKQSSWHSYKLHYDTVLLVLFVFLMLFQYSSLQTILKRDELDIKASERFTISTKIIKSLKWINLFIIFSYDLMQVTYANNHHQHAQERGRLVNKQRIYNVLYHLAKFLVIIIFSIVCLGELINLLIIKRATVDEFQVSKDQTQLSRSQMHCIDEQCSSLLQIQCHGLDNSASRSQPLVLYFSGYYDSAIASSEWLEDIYIKGENGHLLQRYCIIERPGYNDLSSSYTEFRSPISFEDIVKGVKYVMETNYGIDFHPDTEEDVENSKKITFVGYSQGSLFVQLFNDLVDPDVVHSVMFIDGWNQKVYAYGFNWEFNRQFSNIIPRFTKLSNLATYLKSIFAKFNMFAHLEKLWINVILNSNRNSLTTLASSSFDRSKFKEFLTYNLLSKPKILQAKKSLLNTKLSILSTDNLIKASSQWSELQRELVMLSKNVYEWDIVKLASTTLDKETQTIVENPLTEVWRDEIGKKELGKALLRLIES